MKNFLIKVYYNLLSIRNYIIIVYNNVIVLFVKPPLVQTTDDSLDIIINGKCSISRFGDGRNEKHIVCIPNVFKNVDWCTDSSKKYWEKYLNLNRNSIYKMRYWENIIKTMRRQVEDV